MPNLPHPAQVPRPPACRPPLGRVLSTVWGQREPLLLKRKSLLGTDHILVSSGNLGPSGVWEVGVGWRSLGRWDLGSYSSRSAPPSGSWSYPGQLGCTWGQGHWPPHPLILCFQSLSFGFQAPELPGFQASGPPPSPRRPLLSSVLLPKVALRTVFEASPGTRAACVPGRGR